MSVEVTTKRRRVLGSLGAAGTVGGMAAPAQAAQAGGPADYAAQAGKAADYINGHSADVPSEHLGAQLEKALALVASGKPDAATQAPLGKIKGNIQAKGSAYCAPVGKPVTSASQFTEYATNQALDMIALERLGKPIPKALCKSVTDYASSTPKWADPDTDGLMRTALSHVKGSDTDKAKAVTSLEGRLDAAKQGEACGFKGAGPNVNTTAWVASGLYRAGDADHKGQAVKGRAWLVSRQQADGSFGNNAAKTPEGK